MFENLIFILRMKKIIFIIALSILFNQSVISQYIDHYEGGPFLKTTEANVNQHSLKNDPPWYNLENKSILERIFFGDTNSLVEFTAENPPQGPNIARAFRIVKDQNTNACKLQIMQLPDLGQFYRFVEPEIIRKKTRINIPKE